MLEKSREEL